MTRLALAALAPLALALICLAAGPAPDAMLDLIARLDRAEPIAADAVGQLLHVPVTCSTEGPRRDCVGGPFTSGGVTVTGIDFRSTPSRRQSLLILDGLGGDCLPIARVEGRFGTGTAVVDCPGHGCFYHRIQRPWGRISVGQGNDAQASCATTVIMDSYAVH